MALYYDKNSRAQLPRLWPSLDSVESGLASDFSSLSQARAKARKFTFTVHTPSTLVLEVGNFSAPICQELWPGMYFAISGPDMSFSSRPATGLEVAKCTFTVLSPSTLALEVGNVAKSAN